MNQENKNYNDNDNNTNKNKNLESLWAWINNKILFEHTFGNNQNKKKKRTRQDIISSSHIEFAQFVGHKGPPMSTHKLFEEYHQSASEFLGSPFIDYVNDLNCAHEIKQVVQIDKKLQQNM